MGRLLNALYLNYFKSQNRKKGCIFAKGSHISADDVFEGNNYINGKVVASHIGYGTYISDGCFFRNCKIGRFCSIASDVRMIRGTHPTTKLVSTSPAFHLKNTGVGKSFVKEDTFSPYDKKCESDPRFEVAIGNDVWIGCQVSILQGVSIGDGAAIGAGSVVTKDIPPYAIAAGVPAKVVKYRFHDEQIQFLQNIRWWEKEDAWLEGHAELFQDIDALMSCVRQTDEMSDRTNENDHFDDRNLRGGGNWYEGEDKKFSVDRKIISIYLLSYS